MKMTSWDNEERALAVEGATILERNCYYLRFFRECSYATIGKIYEISVEKVKSSIIKCCRLLKYRPLTKKIVENGYKWSIYQELREKYLKGYENNPDNTIEIENSIEILDLSIRSLNLLKRNGYKTIGDIPLDLTELKKIRGLGNKCALEVYNAVDAYRKLYS